MERVLTESEARNVMRVGSVTTRYDGRKATVQAELIPIALYGSRPYSTTLTEAEGTVASRFDYVGKDAGGLFGVRVREDGTMIRA